MASRLLLRSPSHESDLSSLGAGSGANHNFNHRVTFASSCSSNKSLGGGGGGTHSPIAPRTCRPLNIPEIFWLEEDGNHLLKSCGKLADAVGLPKSFSTSDITGSTEAATENVERRNFVSELALCSFQRLVDYDYTHHNKLEQTSRSCSTWVAVGELASTSQLPSPHGTQSINSLQFSSNNALSASNVPILQSGGAGGCGGSYVGGGATSFSTVDLIRSVNKKVRKNYIRRKILMTYRALERMSESEFNLDRLVASAAVTGTTTTVSEQSRGQRREKTTPSMKMKRGVSPGPIELIVPNLNVTVGEKVAEVVAEKVEEEKKSEKPNSSCVDVEDLPEISSIKLEERAKKLSHGLQNKNMTMCDIELERGRSLSKYERNMMIFNWLHSLVLPLEDPSG